MEVRHRNPNLTTERTALRRCVDRRNCDLGIAKFGICENCNEIYQLDLTYI